MSLKTWIAEYYPVASEHCTGSNIQALEHSLLKFKGCLPHNLLRHEVYLHYGSIRDTNTSHQTAPEIFSFGSRTCALCIKHATTNLLHSPSPICSLCPISKNGQRPCMHEKSAYRKFSIHDDPLPMIKELESALKRAGQKSAPQWRLHKGSVYRSRKTKKVFMCLDDTPDKHGTVRIMILDHKIKSARQRPPGEVVKVADTLEDYISILSRLKTYKKSLP